MSRFHKLDANIKAAIEDAGDPAGAPPTMPTETPDEPVNEPEPDPEAQPEKEESMSDTTPVEQTEAYQTGLKAGAKAERDRHSAVFASEHYAGREATAHKLLGKEMSAEDVIDVLAGTPKPEAPKALTEDQQREAAEEAGRKEMQGAISETKNSGIQPGDAAKPDAAAQHGDMWATAYGAPKEGAK